MIRPAPRRTRPEKSRRPGQAPRGRAIRGEGRGGAAPALRFFVAGRLTNPLNSRRHWRAVWASSRTWRTKTADVALVAMVKASGKVGLRRVIEIHDPARPRRITFRAHVARRFDDEGLIAACKPIRDALCPPMLSWRRGRMVGAAGAEMIHSDGPDSGHEFRYEQIVDRANPGVEITAEAIRNAPR